MPFKLLKKTPLPGKVAEEARRAREAARDITMKPAQRSALLDWATMLEGGKLGTGSELFLNRSKTGEALRRITQKGTVTEYLTNSGPWGILVHATGVYGFAKVHAARKRAQVLEAMKLHEKAKPDDFRRLVFSTARFLHQNYRNTGTAIYDAKAEPEIFRLFGEFAQKSDYAKRDPKYDRQPLEDYGKEFFRSLIREKMLSDFNFLMNNYADPAKREAMEYALVGEEIHPLKEAADLRRLNFIEEIFKKDIPELNRFHSGGRHGHMERALQALIRVRHRARMGIGTQESVKFFQQVCNYYRIKMKDADRYAFGLYWGAKNLPRPTMPRLPKDPEKRAKLIESFEGQNEVAEARENELREKILQTYGQETLDKNRPRVIEDNSQRIARTPPMQFLTMEKRRQATKKSS